MTKQIWFTADIHFGHSRIIEFCDRPFTDSDDMTEGIIARWNAVVQPGDDVYILGDVSFDKLGPTVDALRRLNGNLHLIAGNHDKHMRRRAEFKKCFVWVKDIYTLKVHEPGLGLHMDTRRIELFHYAMRTWNKAYHGSWHLYGHSHGTLPDDPNSLSFDVGMDCHDYRPISYDEVKEIMARKTWKKADHDKREN